MSDIKLPEAIEKAMDGLAHDCNATSKAGDELIGLDEVRRAIAAELLRERAAERRDFFSVSKNEHLRRIAYLTKQAAALEAGEADTK